MLSPANILFNSCVSISLDVFDVFRCSVHSQIMKGMVNPGEELMPHRSSYHGGEYKTTTPSCSAPDSKLASDSDHPEEGGFEKEDPEEFTEDEEAMELDLVKCCSGDGGLKKRKRQHVARRLF
jgi:hypothetical protein